MALLAMAATLCTENARDPEMLYQQTEYDSALKALQEVASPNAGQLALLGKCNLMLGHFKPATEYFQKAVSLEPKNSDYMLWLGRSWGRRAENASPLFAPAYAARARECFEKALELNPTNRDALGDLFDYYLDAPGFLGGGADKAERLAKRIEQIDPPQGHFDLAEVARKRRQPGDAERELRTAVKLGPAQVGHVIALARFLARQARWGESDAVLEQARQIAPGSPRVLFATASIYIETNRRLDEAKALLRKYLQAQLTPDDPPRQEAEKLLKTATGG